MFIALSLPSPAGGPRAALFTLACEFSPRVERIHDDLLVLDVAGLGRWFEGPRALGEALRRTAADRGLAPHVAVAATRTAAILGARGWAGLTVIAPGEESVRLAPLPLAVLAALPSWPQAGVEPRRSRKASSQAFPLATLRRWGLKTLGDLADLPAVELSERLGQAGVAWHRLARGEDLEPLVPVLPDERFEESLELDWPIDGLEPLSFVLGRLFEALSARLERADRGVAVLHVRLDLVGRAGRERFTRALQLPAPMRDARTLRTLALLDLESNPPPAAIDRVTVAADVVEGRVLQFSLLARALPTERVSTLLARLSALVGADRVGAPALVDSHRPGAFEVGPFDAATVRPSRPTAAHDLSPAADRLPSAMVRRFRHPIPVRVEMDQGRPVRVVSSRRHLPGGCVAQCAGPWRTSGDWWVGEEHLRPARGERVFERRSARPWGWGPTGPEEHLRPARGERVDAWDRDEWDVSLPGGVRYVVFCDRRRGSWFIDGILD